METKSLFEPVESTESWDVKEAMFVLMLLLDTSEAATRTVNAGPFETELFLSSLVRSGIQDSEANPEFTSLL